MAGIWTCVAGIWTGTICVCGWLGSVTLMTGGPAVWFGAEPGPDELTITG